MEKDKFTIEYSPSAENTLYKEYPRSLANRIMKAIEERLTVAPYEYGKPMLREYKNHRRLRVGDYRVIYRVFDEKVLVLIVEVGDRKDIYE